MTSETTELYGDLKGLGYDQPHSPDFLKETRALAMDVQIKKTTEADRAHAENEGPCPFEINKCSLFGIGSFGR